MASMDDLNVGGNVGEGGGDIIGTIIGELLAAGDYAKAEQLALEAGRNFDNIALPGEAEKMGPTAYERISVDPRIRSARMSAMDRLLQSGLDGGMDVESRAAIEEAKGQAGQYEQAQRGAIMADAARRGLTGSNMSIGAQLDASQAGANRVGMEGMRAAADARRRAQESLLSSGQLAGGIERDEYGQQRDLAANRDAIAEFNARTANDWAQQNFNNQMTLQGKRYDADLNEADVYQKKGDKTVRTARGIGRAGGRVIGTGAALL